MAVKGAIIAIDFDGTVVTHAYPHMGMDAGAVPVLKELVANDCKLINLRYEYHGYTGTEKWAIVTELAEEELWVKYPDVIRRYTPFILLSMAQGEVITEYQNYEARERMRRLLFGHAVADWVKIRQQLVEAGYLD